MIKVQLPDLRIVELKTKEKAEAYAKAMGGQVVKKPKKAPKKNKLKQFFERS